MDSVPVSGGMCIHFWLSVQRAGVVGVGSHSLVQAAPNPDIRWKAAVVMPPAELGKYRADPVLGTDNAAHMFKQFITVACHNDLQAGKCLMQALKNFGTCILVQLHIHVVNQQDALALQTWIKAMLIEQA